jgi:hypothetical protein
VNPDEIWRAMHDSATCALSPPMTGNQIVILGLTVWACATPAAVWFLGPWGLAVGLAMLGIFAGVMG